MTWVNDTLPPRLRDRWLLITIRLSMSSLAGTARTLVAVGTWRLASMFCTTRADAPRSGTSSVSAAGSAAAGRGAVRAGLLCAGVGVVAAGWGVRWAVAAAVPPAGP